MTCSPRWSWPACIALVAAIAGCNPDHIDLPLPPPVDASVEARPDAFVPRRDAGADAGSDAGNDARSDAGNDAGRDAGTAPVCVVNGGGCDPFERDPCGSNRTCISDATTRTRCVASAFTLRGEGATCSVDNQCEERLECRALVDGVLRCMRQCRIGSAGECGAHARCLTPARDGETCLGLCLAVNGCDLFEQDCVGGACVLIGDPETEGDDVSVCAPVGTTPSGQACAWADSCVRGAACIGGTCRQLCRDDRDCTTGTCTGRTASGVGYCR